MHDIIDDLHAIAEDEAVLLLHDAKQHIKSVLCVTAPLLSHLKRDKVRDVRITLHEHAQHDQQVVADLFAVVVQTLHQLLKGDGTLVDAIAHERLEVSATHH